MKPDPDAAVGVGPAGVGGVGAPCLNGDDPTPKLNPACPTNNNNNNNTNANNNNNSNKGAATVKVSCRFKGSVT